jgi:hypothetical protein
MINYEWLVLEIYSNNDNIHQVRFMLKAKDEKNTVETEGYHLFSEGVVYKPFAEIKEEDLIRWLEQDTTKDEVNIIKLNLEKQLKSLKSSEKADFPWLANTFTIE